MPVRATAPGFLIQHSSWHATVAVMPVLLITGPHQSGKSRRLWELLRAEPPGSAVLVRPEPGFPHELARQVHAWSGPGLMPPVLSLGEFVERCAAGAAIARRPLPLATAAHLLRPWCERNLAATPWHGLSGFRATATELADACLRLDDHRITDDDLALAGTNARQRGDGIAAAHAHTLARARAALRAPGRATAGERLRELADSGTGSPWASIYLDDFISLTPAELELLRSLSHHRLVATAIDDHRLGPGSPSERLLAAFPGAERERLERVHPRSPHASATRTFLAHALDHDRRLDGDGVSRYRYRDPVHAGRAIAAWLRRAGQPPNQATVYVRVCDGEALALADALAAAGVPVHGEFQIPIVSTPAGGLLRALGAWCADGTWESLLAVCARLGIAGVADGVAPLRLEDLLMPWARLPAAEALERLARVQRDGELDAWGWSEPDRSRPRLRTLVAWMGAWHARLRPVNVKKGAESSWAASLLRLVESLSLGGEIAALVRRLADLDALAAAGPRELDDLLGATRVEVRRGGHDDATRCLLIVDAVRGRSWTRPLAIIHGLEHGRWPRAKSSGTLLPPDARAALASGLPRDCFDEAGREAGEIASLLAVAARARDRLLIGIPCGEREPSAWLATLAEQLGWDLEQERSAAEPEAAPGAPLGPDDSQGEHERALWIGPVGIPLFTFTVPACWPQRLHPAELNAVFSDGFAIVCDRLALGSPWNDLSVMSAGTELHALLARLVEHPPERWTAALEPLLGEWLAAAEDELDRAQRDRACDAIRDAISTEAGEIPGATSLAEVKLTIPLEIPGLGRMELTGRIDRLDRLREGPVRVVDYKRGAGTYYRPALAARTEGQLLAYCLGLQAVGEVVDAAYYLGLRDGVRPGYLSLLRGGKPRAGQVPMSELDACRDRLVAAIARFAAGEVAADRLGASAMRGYAPIARLDEARLDDGGDASADPANALDDGKGET